eukprot:scaffold44447_cov19-Tisochrysis_lutea.AAC.1
MAAEVPHPACMLLLAAWLLKYGCMAPPGCSSMAAWLLLAAWLLRSGRYSAIQRRVASSEKYGMVIGKAWFAGPSILDLADTSDPLFLRFNAFLHNASRESKGWCAMCVCVCVCSVPYAIAKYAICVTRQDRSKLEAFPRPKDVQALQA